MIRSLQLMIRLANAQWHPIPDRPGKPYINGTPHWKMVLHTTEGTTVDSALEAYARFPPHLLYDPSDRQLIQHISLDKASYALRGSASEASWAVQLEIVGRARSSSSMSEEMLAHLCEDVLIPVRKYCPFALASPEFHGPEGYGAGSIYRMALTQWQAYTGIVGHQHAPSPDTHWDPGLIPIDFILTYLRIRERQQKEEPTVPEPSESDQILAKLDELLAYERELAAVLRYTVDVERMVDRMYWALLGRKRRPDEQYWVTAIRNGADVVGVEHYIATSAEAQAHRRFLESGT